MKGKKALTREQFTKESRGMADYIQSQGAKLQEVARLLNTLPDYSPATMRAAEDLLSHMKNVVGCLKKVNDLNVQRGLSALEEEKAKALSDLDARRQQLLDGTLRLNRRAANDQAAE